MKRTLDEIRKDFEGLESSSDSMLAYVTLMNELERDYYTFIIEPSEAFLNRPEVVLYRQICDSRIFE